MIIDNPIVSGSLNVQNNVTASNGLFTGDVTVLGSINATVQGTTATASYVALGNVDGFTDVSSSISSRLSAQENFSSSLNSTFATDAELSAVSGALALSISSISTDFADITNKPTLISSSAQIASDISGSFTSTSSSLAQRVSTNETNIASLTSVTSSYLQNTTDTLTGDLTVTGKITAQEFHTELVSASILYESGSTQFGNSLDDTHKFTGSVSLTGSLFINGSEVGTGKLDETVFNSYTSSTDQRLDIAEGSISSLNDATSSYALQASISGAFASTSSSLAQRIASQENFSSSLDATFATDVQVTAAVSDLNAATSSYALQADISGAFASTSSSLAQRISAQEDFSSSLDATFATDAELSAVSGALALSISSISTDFADITNKPTLISSSAQIASDISGSSTALSSSLSTRIAAQESFSSSLSTTELILSGSFSGSFVGDGSQLSGVTSYTDADTLAFINSRAVLSGSIAELTSVTASFLNTGSVTIPHSFNSKNVSVSVYDSNDILIIPQEIALISNNAVKLTFGGSTSGFAVVSKGGHIVSGSVPVPQLSTVTSAFTSATSHTVTHNFNTKEVIVSVYENDSLIIPDTVTTDDVNNVTVTFPEAISGRVVVVKAGHIVSGSIPFDNLLSSPFVQGTSAVTASKHIVPSQDITYDLGSSDLRFRDIYLASASIYLGNTVISEDNVVTTASLASALPGGTLSGSAQIASDISGSFTSVSASIASDLVSNYLRNTTDTLTGNLTVTGTLTAQEFHTEFVSASILHESGSTVFGNSSDDTHQFTGKIGIGTSPTTNQLYVNADSATSVVAKFANTNYGYSSIELVNSAGSVGIAGIGNNLYTSNNVGIGTTSPDAPLTVHSSTDPEIRFGYNSSQDHRITWDSSKVFIHADPENANGSSALGLAVDGTTRLYINDSGNVGIGTTTPRVALDINGEVAIAYNATYGLRFYNDAGNNWSSIGNNITGSSNANLVFKDAFGEAMRIEGGNVGIGTDSPAYKLDVSGDSTSGVVAIRNAANGRDTLRSENAAGTRTFNIGNDSSGHGIVLVRNSSGTTTNYIAGSGDSYLNGGNVGIGTTSPSGKVHIVDTTNPDATGGSLIIEGRRDGSANLLTLRAKDASAPTVALPNGQGSVIRFQGFDGTDFENMGYIQVAADGQAVADGDAPSFMAFGTSADASSSPTERMRIDSNGNINILNATSTNSRTIGITNAAGTTGWTLGNGVIASSHQFVIYDNTAGQSRILIDSDGNVGIGTTSPSAKLEIIGNVRSYLTQTGITKIQVGNSVAASGDGAVFEGVYGSTQISALGFNWTGAAFESYLDFYGRLDIRNQSDSILMTVLSGGSVGIGTTSPDNKLQVIGNVKASYNGNNYSRLGQNSSGGYIQAYSGGSENIMFRSYGDSFIANNLGIGTTSPIRKLHIDGGSISSDTPTVRISSTDSSGTNKFGIEFYSNNGADVRGKLLADNNGRVYIDDNGGGGVVLQANGGSGNVGINTSTTRSKLHVNGTLQVGAVDALNDAMVFTWAGSSSYGKIQTFSSSDLSLNPDGNNVGIGTTDPSEKFHMLGGKVRIHHQANGFAWIYAEDINHSLIIRGNRSSTVGNYTHYHQYGGDYSAGGGHHFWTGGVLASQSLRFSIANDYSIFQNTKLIVNGTTTSADLFVNGTTDLNGVIKYRKVYGSIDTTGNVVARLIQASNGASAFVRFECYGGGGYQRIVYSCINSGGNWSCTKQIDEGANALDVTATSGLAPEFTFKGRSASQGYSPSVSIEGTALDPVYYS